jgi:hypothetical protein
MNTKVKVAVVKLIPVAAVIAALVEGLGAGKKW